MKFRMIHFQKFNAFMNMAIDEAIMEAIRAGMSLPTIRFYGWTPSAISIGFFQGLLNEVNLEACQQEGIDVVRRLTGGGAVYHDSEGEVTYSILGPVEIFPPKILDSYQVNCSDIQYALQLMNIQASFEPINDLIVDGKKISGNAQTRRSGVLLQHGTILYKVDVEKMFSLLNVSKEKISDKLISSVKKRVTSIDAYSSASIQDLIDAMEKGFSRDREIILGDYTPAELNQARHLADQKYSTNDWVGMR
jgi:lipoate---protein ligase